MNYTKEISALDEEGFSVRNEFYSYDEIQSVVALIGEKHSLEHANLTPVFAIRNVLESIPSLIPMLFNANLIGLLKEIDPKLFLTKSIYFDKPEDSNWFVAYHQDLSISVKNRHEVDGYKNWTNKKGLIGVQPPLEILAKTLTIRIHLDQTATTNGALKVIPKSHLHGIVRPTSARFDRSNEKICAVDAGGIMLMKPLLFHASNRSQNGTQRRVIHLEFCSQELEAPLSWSEKFVW